MKSANVKRAVIFLIALTAIVLFECPTVLAEQWTVPLAGNTFRTQPAPGRIAGKRGSSLRLKQTDEIVSIFFHVDRSALLSLSLRGRGLNGASKVLAAVGDQSLETQVDKKETDYDCLLGDVEVSGASYVQVDLQIETIDESASVELSELRVVSSTQDLTIDFVRNNDGNMFYWGRRGPSVHLSYQIPTDTPITYAYSEITVPTDQDAIGSYFMANGFSEGYFGFQVNSATERRVLFSVWSPFRTDDPSTIPDDQRVKTLAKGEDVSAQDFGNEGSGGQSFLVYPWKANATYRFLTEVKPDGEGNTRYTSWFGDKQAGEWRLIANFQRPKTDKHLTGFHSFLENFSPEFGYQPRSAKYGNQWVRDIDGRWHEITRAKFTGDNTARGRHRLDYAGGSANGTFFLRNCGFFAPSVTLDQQFERDSIESQRPDIEWDALPRN
jgi:hypothetical protein